VRANHAWRLGLLLIFAFASNLIAAETAREFKIEKHYLNIPIKNGAPKRVVKTLFNGQVETKSEIELADSTPDWWAPMDVSAFHGKTITLEVEKLPENSKALAAIEQSDQLKDAANLYDEALRGQFHFSSMRGWNNDPNGLVHFKGEYHLFFQHNPYGWGWGNMHWGHAVSRDLVHWRELGDVMSPDKLGPMFSGSAVVDHGLLNLIYTAAGNPTVQCLATSRDGRRFTKFSGNPILQQITPGNRDPKVIRYEPTKRWIMPLYVETNKVHIIQFFTSPNLTNWTYASKIDGFFECPDFFELPLDGDKSNRKWILTAANSDYMIGSFDGTTFTPETSKLKGHRGKGFYAAQTFSDIPARDGRRIQIGWFQTETKGMPFNQSMTIPLELKLVSTAEGPRLTWTPARELQKLRAKTHHLKPNATIDLDSDLLEVRATFDTTNATEITIVARGIPITYDTLKQQITINKTHTAFAPPRDGHQSITFYLDRTGIELFASDGLTYVPFPIQASPGNRSLEIKSTAVTFRTLDVYELMSAWK
jgi:fructan beta-fructosidase